MRDQKAIEPAGSRRGSGRQRAAADFPAREAEAGDDTIVTTA
jgi:hypothetical protein